MIVCGAGPGGAALAAYLCRGGLDVLLIDRTGTPTDRVGESLLPFGNRVLEELAVDMSGFQEKRGAVFTSGGRRARIDFGEAIRRDWTTAYQVRRGDFDQRLRRVAVDAGARFLEARITRVDPPLVQTASGDFEADWVIDALGQHGILGRSKNLRRVHPVLRNVARSSKFRGIRWGALEQPGDIVITAFKGGWFWMIPFSDGTASVGLVTTIESGLAADFPAAISQCPEAAARLADAEPFGGFRGSQDFSQCCDQLHGPGWALLGDAAVFIDPVFSSGVLLALESARALSSALLAGSSLEAYENTVRSASQAFEHAALAFYDGAFFDVLFSPPSQQSAQIRSEIVGLLAGDVFDQGRSAGPLRIASRLGTLARFLGRPGA